MAALLNSRNQILSTATSRVSNLAANISFITGNTFTLSAQGNTATPNSVTMHATSFNFTSPKYAWFRKIGAAEYTAVFDSATNLPVTLSDLTVTGDLQFILDVGAETYVQYKVVIAENNSTTIKTEAVAVVQVLRQGSSSVIGVLSNDALVLSADQTGKVLSYNNASVVYSVFSGTSLILSTVTFTASPSVEDRTNAPFYNFATNTLQGWFFSGINTATTFSHVRISATINDPIINSPILSLTGYEFDKVFVKIKRVAGTGWQGTCYYSTKDHGSAEEYARYITQPTALQTAGTYAVLEFDMANLANGGADWVNSIITGIRLDFGSSASDIFDIEYVAFGKGISISTLAGDSNRVYLSAMSVDNAFIDCSSTSGGVATSKRFSIAKAKSGSIGKDSIAYWLNTSATIVKVVGTTLTPSSIFITGYSGVGSSAPAAYSGRFIVKEDGVVKYTSSANESTTTYTPSASTVANIVVEMYATGGTTLLLDSQTVSLIRDGKDGITGVLTNETSVLPADNAGNVSSFAGASTRLIIYNGTVDDTANWTIARTVTNVTTTEAATSATQTISSFAQASDIGYITFTATRTGYSSILKTFSVTKSKTGSAGTSATAYSVEPTVQVIIKKADNSLNPATLDIVCYSTVGTTKSLFTGAKLKIYEGTLLLANGVSVNSTTALYTYTPSATAYTASTVKVEMYLADGTTLVDSQTIPILVAGSSAMKISVSNPVVGLPSSILGVVSSYSGSGTDIIVSEGENLLTYLTTLGTTAGTFTVGTPTLSVGGSITVGSFAGNNTTKTIVTNHSTLASLVDSVIITFPVTYIRFNGAKTTESITQSIAKVKSGSSGTRGNVRELVDGFSSWDSALATVTSLFINRYGGVIISDSVTVYDGFGFSETRSWNGTGWIVVTQYIDGNLLVSGTITGDKLSTNLVTVGQKIVSSDSLFIIDMVNKFISISI